MIFRNPTHVVFEIFRWYQSKSRMATFLKAKLKKSDDQTNIDKYS